MKEFRKTPDALLICEECGKLCKSIMSLSKHFTLSHNMTVKEYYDKWLKEEGEGLCKICGKETKFINFSRCYQKTCSTICNFKLRGKNMSSPERREKIKQTCLKKYGVENPLANIDIRKKILENNLKKYGVENPYQREDVKEKIKQIKKEKYGDEKYQNWNKQRQTCLERYGNECALLNDKVKEKTKITMMNRYGVVHQSQNDDIHYRQMNNGKKIKYFKYMSIWYQGSYELDFLEKYYDKYSDIERGPSIKYIFRGKNKIYHPDFYIPSLNLIIEIKDSYRARKDKRILIEKKKAVIKEGFNFIMIINKNYNELDYFLSQGTSNL